MKRYFGTGRLRLWTWMFMSMRLGFAALLALGSIVNGVLLGYRAARSEGKAGAKVRHCAWAALAIAYAAFIAVMQLYNFWSL